MNRRYPSFPEPSTQPSIPADPLSVCRRREGTRSRLRPIRTGRYDGPAPFTPARRCEPGVAVMTSNSSPNARTGSVSATLAAGLLLAATLAVAQAPPIRWISGFDGGGTPFATDVLVDMAVHASGAICVTGSTATAGGAVGAMTLLYDPDGSERWRRLYVAPDSAGYEEGARAFFAPDGRCLVAGRRSSATTGPDALLLSYDANGDLAWSASHDGAASGFDIAVDVAADADGNAFVLALVAGGDSGWDFATLKYDAAGALLWSRTFDGPLGQDDQPAGLVIDAGGNAYVAGHARVTAPFDDDVVLIKFDPDGNELWTRYLDGGAAGTDLGAAVALSAANEPYVAGRFQLPEGEHQAAIFKLHADGTDDWSATTGHPVAGIPEQVRALALGADGSAYVVFTGSNDVLVTRFDASGTFDWRNLEDGVALADFAPRPLAIDAAGNAYVAAWDFVPGEGSEFHAYRIDAADGTVAWRTHFGEPGDDSQDFPRAVVLTPANELVVAGGTRPDGATFEDDWAVVAYALPTIFTDHFETGDASHWTSAPGR